MAKKDSLVGVIVFILIVVGVFFFFNQDKVTIPPSTLLPEISELPSPAEKVFSAIPFKTNIIYSELAFSIFATQADYDCRTCPTDPNTDCCFLPSLGETWDSACANLCPEEEEIPTETCASGFVFVGDGKCCPNNFPNYCSQNNLCYAESNCGMGVGIDNIVCHDSNGVGLDKKVMGKTCAPISQCIFGGSEGAGSCGEYGYAVGDDPNWAYCNQPIWVGTEPPPEIKQLGIDYRCDSCAGTITHLSDHELVGTLCQINDQCQIEELICIDSRNFNTCQEISHQLYVSPFKVFSGIQSCPENTICNVNRCEVDSDGDGFPNSLDQCPNNAPNIIVDKFGCPIICEENQARISGGCINLSIILSELEKNITLLGESLAEKIRIIQDLNLNLQEQADIINSLELTSSEQAEILNNLQLTISEQATLINDMDRFMHPPLILA